MMRERLSRLRFLLARGLPAQERRSELDEEIRFHVERATEAKVAVGMTAAEARRQALIEFGGVERTREQCHEQRPGWWLGTVLQDVRYGLRQLRGNRGFTLTAVITLGLGMGATSTIFSAVNSLLLRPLPYRDASTLMWVSNYWPKIHMDRVMSPNFIAARSESRSFEQLAAYTYLDGNLTGAGEPTRIIRANVTANFLPMLGAAAQIGRTFSDGEDKAGGSNVVVLSDRLWRGQFHADPHIAGRVVILDGVEETVIGVLPPRFRFPDVQLEPDVYTPLGLETGANVTDRRIFLLSVIGRLRPGVSAQQAHAEMLTFFLARTQNYPAGFARMAQGQEAAVEPLQRHIVGDNRKPLLILLVSVGLVLLIACANVANLQLARAASRRHETAVRGALGASRTRLVRQFLIESLILSLFSAVLGLLIAVATTALLRSLQIPDTPQAALYSEVAQMLRLPFGKLTAAIQVDGWVLAFTAGIAFLTTVLTGLVPAVGGTRNDLRNALQSAGLRMTSGREQRLLRHSLLLAEVALAVVLLASAGLLIRSFVNVLRYDSGFDPRNTLTAVTLLNSSRYSTAERREAFVDRLLPKLSALPGVTAVAAASTLPIQPYDLSSAITFEDIPAPPVGMRPAVSVVSVTPDYFRTVGTPIFQGRTFNPSDTALSAPVTIVNRAFANRFFGGDALGKRFHSMAWGPDHAAVTIVGVADDVRHGGLEQDVQPEMIVPMAQLPQSTVSIAVRTAGSPATVANALRQAVWAVDSEQPVFDIETMDQRVSEAIAQRRLIMLLIACFAMLAVVLCAVGVYGVFSYSVTQRMREMGIRLALGASRRGVLRLVVTEAARLILVGGILGVGAALALSRLLSSLLVGVTPHDAMSFSLAWVLMTATALLASAIPAANAARTDLMAVLRSE
jgi:putative ABC transport system permease protein